MKLLSVAMHAAILHQLHETRPFTPFTISMADGRKLLVPHNEFLSFFPGDRAAILTHNDYKFTVIDLLMVTAVDVASKRSRRRIEKQK